MPFLNTIRYLIEYNKETYSKNTLSILYLFIINTWQPPNYRPPPSITKYLRRSTRVLHVYNKNSHPPIMLNSSNFINSSNIIYPNIFTHLKCNNLLISCKKPALIFCSHRRILMMILFCPPKSIELLVRFPTKKKLKYLRKFNNK